MYSLRLCHLLHSGGSKSHGRPERQAASSHLRAVDSASKLCPARASRVMQLQWPLAAAHMSGVCSRDGGWEGKPISQGM